MLTVIGVRFRAAGKIYYFDPADRQIKIGDHVIVETARGIEYGYVVLGNREVDETKVIPPLKPVIRMATDEDRAIEAKNKEKEKEAFKICQEKIKKHNLEMKLIDAEYTFDNNKVLFYFTADGRIDFRELVKDLASVFKTRIELRQVGVRDETKIMGGYGICGRELCCHTFLSEFAPVSIKMAKTKDKQKKEGEEEKTQEMRDKETVRDFIELCPVISMDGGKMSPMDVNTIYKKLESVYIDRLVRKGFDDPCLYVQEELNKIDPNIINNIGENGGQAPDEKRKDAKETIDLSHMTEEQRAAWEEKIRQKKAEAAEKAKKKAQKDEEFRKQWESWSEEEREEWQRQEAERIARREKAKEEREEFRKRITNIRGIALRIPLLMYGGADAGDTKEDITVDNFTRKISNDSWFEFMPKGISKSDFNKIKKCFNATRFEEAGKKYRALTREADFMHVDERIRQITEIFSYFRNPDKETVLTPWRVVNMHMSDTIGGYCFYDESFDEKTGQLVTPRYVDQGDVTRQLFDNVDLAGEVQTKILEINSKTGLYPLYITYSLYRRRLKEYIKAECIDIDSVSVEDEQTVWDDIIKDNIYVICNTPMAVGITRRTLFGFRDVERKANIKDEQLIKRASNDQESLRDISSNPDRENILKEFFKESYV